MRYCSVLALLFVFALCTLPSAAQQRGKATYYSRKATGMRMSDGTRHHADSMICAHRKYPFGTRLKVTNPANGRVVVVKVTDRGPFAKGRIIDLSYAAAKELDILSQGVAMVVVEPYHEPSKYPFRMEDKTELPELDYEITEHGLNMPKTEDKDKKNGAKSTVKPKQHTDGKTR